MVLSIRQRALERIAALSQDAVNNGTDIERLSRACPTSAKEKATTNGNHGNASSNRSLMTIREYETLIALCKAAPAVRTAKTAQKLARQLSPYILESHSQGFAPSPAFRKVEPSPVHSITFHVTAALLCLGRIHGDIHDHVSASISAYVEICARHRALASTDSSEDEETGVEEALRTATMTASLVGFLDAAAAQPDFWRAGGRLGLIQRVRELMSDTFLTAIEAAFSTIRNSHHAGHVVGQWRGCLKHYHNMGQPAGASLLQRGFMRLVAASTALLVADIGALRKANVLEILMTGDGLVRPMTGRSGDADFKTIDTYASIVLDQMGYIEAGADFMQMGSPAEQRITFGVKSACLVTYINCARLNEDAVDKDLLMGWVEDALTDPVQMNNDDLAAVVLRTMAILCRMAPQYAPAVTRLLPRFIVQSGAQSHTVVLASQCLAFILKRLSKDAVITTMYTLGNVLSPANGTSQFEDINGGFGSDSGNQSQSQLYKGRQSIGSSISLQLDREQDSTEVQAAVIDAICGIANACNEAETSELAISILLQKFDRVSSFVDGKVIEGAAVLSLSSGVLEFRSLLKGFARFSHIAVVEKQEARLTALLKARNHISANIRRESELFDLYWEHMLENIVSKGDYPNQNEAKESDIELAAAEIGQLLQPLAIFMQVNDLATDDHGDDESQSRLRDAWFNIAVHGFISSTDRGKRYMNELRTIAIHSPPLVAEQRGEQNESYIELNTVLRRGLSSEREAMQKKYLSDLLPTKTAEIKALSYRKVNFMHATYMVESLRAEAGDCTKVLSYFLEPSMRRGEISSVMEGITTIVVDKFLRKTLNGTNITFSKQYAAAQLASIFCSCCHRIDRVQQAAYACADRIIRDVPSALSQRSSLFALLELLSLMWSSCLEAETDRYEPRSIFESVRGNVTLELSDDYPFRKLTLDRLTTKSRVWVSSVLNIAPADIKGLLQTYLSEFDDEGAYGHISLGRSLALEMGSVIPTTNQRLVSIDRVGEGSVNTASDFMAQYTTRQEYRYAETLPDNSLEWLSFIKLERRGSFSRAHASGPTVPGSVPNAEHEGVDALTALAHIENRILRKQVTPIADIRDILRRAAALLCRRESTKGCAVAHHLVSIPFALFSKQSIKLGVSLWLGVLNENSIWESRILTEIAQQWESTIQKRLGLFSHTVTYPDPFFLKEEFAPSDQEGVARRRDLVQNLLAPHSRLLQFLSSHYNASRLGSPDTHKVFLRLVDVTLNALKGATPHPLAREIRFQIILFSLRVLRTSTTVGTIAQWRLKDNIFSAALSWFSHTPEWSFGSSVLQLKTEIRLLSDVMAAIKSVAFIGSHVQGSFRSLQALQSKEQLLLLLLESEQSRLLVWTHPLNEPSMKPPTMAHDAKGALQAELVPLIRTAWQESPSLAIELATRFHNPRIHKEVRWLLLNFTDKTINYADAVPLLLGDTLPGDVTSQLKYLLYWSPTNPITAVTYFRPSYRNDPYMIQYAMRALESHSIDVTFFYVPQIVQALRYDALGYAERYIVETAQFSPLFAHQIIWNMKANSYKDDDAQVPDEIKPVLDRVTERMINSFSVVDRAFYLKEFTFFDEVTDISGKLKPLIKRSKPEKKQKIEEELRRINVEVGVYLPSNPDGVVIGIDRKSGKPLQSHAKAPFMATFRISKNKGNVDETGDMAEQLIETGKTNTDNTIQVWQSAIFKVGDDCRQDVLALQMIAAFRGIFQSVGLDVYVFPYRVTATAPGCGVIDVLPNSISRDMLGREAVNGLYDYFISKYGNEDSLRFQQVRNNFVKSMAAYSIISFLLQFKDRHNGNIMVDDAGHILHIDFGFCFDIAPGGIKFERAPFKLTSEMVAVMGGKTEHQSFQWFEELCVKAFLASRQHVDKLSQIVLLMMDSGLPCFKPDSVKNFKDRFVLDKSEREAAEFVRMLVRKSYASYSTAVYDQFQLMTNGIPY